MKTYLKIFLTSWCILFFSWFLLSLTHVNSLVIQSEDTIPAIFLPYAILKDHTLYLDKYYEQMKLKYPNSDDKGAQFDLVPFYLRRVVTYSKQLDPQDPWRYLAVYHYVSAFPIVTALAALPVYAPFVFAGVLPTWENLTLISHLAAAFIVSLASVAFFILVRKHFLQEERKALFLTAIFSLCTVNFALVSQALWQHGTLQLFLIIGLYYLLTGLGDAPDKELNFFWAGLFLGIAILSRPTAGLAYVLLWLLIWFKYKFSFKELFVRTFYYGMGLIPVIAFFFWYNQTYYLSILNQGYSNQLGNSWLSPFPQGLLGVWFSPSKGILTYSPLFIFSLVSVWQILRNKVADVHNRYKVFALIVLLHTLIISLWKQWYGGWSFGYRMSSDVIPFLVLLLVPYLQSSLYLRTKKLFWGLAIFSAMVQVYGLIFFDGVWHAVYDGGFRDQRWLWSIRDSEVAFNIRRVLVKLGLLAKACPQCLPGK